MSTFRRTTCCLGLMLGLMAVCCFLPSASAQQPYPQSLYSGLRWRMIGPFRGGRVNAVSGVPGQPNTFYFGSVGGGVWKIDQRRPHLGAGVRFAAGRLDRRHCRRALESDRRLRRHGREPTCAIRICLRQRGLQVHRRRQHLEAPRPRRHAADRPRPGRPEEPGCRLRRSARPCLRPEPGPGRVPLARRRRDLAEGALQERQRRRRRPRHRSDRTRGSSTRRCGPPRRPPWSIYPPSNGPGSGLYKSTDGGTTWQPLTAGLPAEAVGRIGLAVAPTTPAACTPSSTPRRAGFTARMMPARRGR